MGLSVKRGTLSLVAATLLAGTAVADEFGRNWGLAMVGVDVARGQGLTGKGVRIGVIDTGIDSTHPEFEARYAGGIDFTTYGDPGDDADDHGTHVAGIIGAADDGVGMQGVSPDSTLYSYRAIGPLHPDAGDYFDKIFAHASENDIHILNASFGIPALDILPDEVLRAMAPGFEPSFARLSGADTVVVFATGNDGSREASVLSRLPQFLPGLQPSWIAVTAVGPTGEISGYANHCGSAAQWCLAAPGGDEDGSGNPADAIHSTVPGGYAGFDGTSMAAPHVSGALALAKEAFPGASYHELARLVLHTATDAGTVGVDSVYGWGLLNVGNMVVAANGNHMGLHALSGRAGELALAGVIDTVSSRAGDRMAAEIWEDPMAGRYPSQVENRTASAVWLSPFASRSSLGAGGGLSGADVGVAGLLAGASLLELPFGTAGVFGGAVQSELESAIGKASSFGYHVGGYVDLDAGAAVGSLQAGYSTAATRTERTGIPGLAGTVLQGTAETGKGREDAWWIAARAGVRLDAGPVELTPYLHGGVVDRTIHATVEDGATALAARVDGARAYDPTAGVGIEVALGGIVAGSYVLTPSLDVAYAHHLGDLSHTRTGTVLGNPSTASTGSLGAHRIDIGAAVSFASTKGPLEVKVGYDGSFREGAATHGAKASLAVRF